MPQATTRQVFRHAGRAYFNEGEYLTAQMASWEASQAWHAEHGENVREYAHLGVYFEGKTQRFAQVDRFDGNAPAPLRGSEASFDQRTAPNALVEPVAPNVERIDPADRSPRSFCTKPPRQELRYPAANRKAAMECARKNRGSVKTDPKTGENVVTYY